MAENKKSIIEEALLDASRIQEALNTNAKEILRSVAREEIDELVKESLNEDDYEEEDVEDTDDTSLDNDDYDGSETEDEESEDSETYDDDESDEESESDEDEADDDIENTYDDDADMDDMEGSIENYEDEEGSEDDYETMDMTGASDDEVISVYKKLSGDDEIEVISDKEVHIKDPESGNEYQIKLGGEEETESNETPEEYDEYSESIDGDDETIYEIELEEISETEDIESQKAPVGDENKDNWAGDNLEGGFDDNGQNGTGDNHGDHIMEDETVTEEDEISDEDDTVDETGYVGGKVKRVATSHTNKKIKENVSENFKEKYKKLLAESEKLKKQNEEFRVALKKFRKMLGETVVFNTNLTNVTRLFTEHSTTREEKEAIIARFDEEATTIKESKRLYKIIAKELSNKKPISEVVNDKIAKESNSSQGSKQLNETTVYVDESTKRIKDLINRVENFGS